MTDLECFVTKGVGRVRFSIPLHPEFVFMRNITIDVLTIHANSDPTYIGEARHIRINQMNQVMPAIENSDAEIVILGGDFNDIPLSGEIF